MVLLVWGVRTISNPGVSRGIARKSPGFVPKKLGPNMAQQKIRGEMRDNFKDF
jgi:hypothetical protein